MGKILRVDLTTGATSSLSTSKYDEYGGGHGIGSAIFWELCADKTVSAFDPRNVITMMTSPLCGTLAPSAASRTEVQGIGAQPYPVEWFTRSNFGGRFAAMLKYAGWDGIVIEGRAKGPVWLDIRDADVQIRDAKSLWGLLTNETTEEIWRSVSRSRDYGDWMQASGRRDAGQTTQRPAVVCIGPSGERLSRIAALVHDGGNAAGQGGFGGIFGAKNLKAISVLGTGSVSVAEPTALMRARLWLQQGYRYNVDDPVWAPPVANAPTLGQLAQSPGYAGILPIAEPARPHACLGCPIACRRRNQSGLSNESMCAEAVYYTAETQRKTMAATDLVQHYGVNVFDVRFATYLRDLYKMGVLGAGKPIESKLPFDKFGTYDFMEQLVRAIAYRTDIGDALAEGWVRAAKTWGRLEEDLTSGLLKFPQWGYSEHYDPRTEVEWSYGSILGDRDINEHDTNFAVHWMPLIAASFKLPPLLTAEELSKVMAEKLVPYNDPMMIDHSSDGIYSDAKVKMIAWHRHYSRFWKQGALNCDWAYPNFFNPESPDLKGFTPEAEPMFWNAVTGQRITFADGMELGRKVWNLDRAIWVLQGRTREMEVHSEYVYRVPTTVPDALPVYEGGKWSYSDCLGRTLDKQRFEDWKTRFYRFEGWDTRTGWPTRQTLEGVKLGFVADELERNRKLGA